MQKTATVELFFIIIIFYFLAAAQIKNLLDSLSNKLDRMLSNRVTHGSWQI